VTRRALIVDDSLTVRMDLKDAFEGAGFAVSACSNLQEARAALSETSFALVVLDVLLPDGDGVDFLRELKSNRQTASLPVILLSTETQVRDRVRGLKTGADEYVGKPYDSGYVVARARELMRSHDESAGADRRPTVLVIDDSVTFRNEIQEILQSAGYDVTTAASGEEGLHSAVNNRPAAVIVDGSLPGIDGGTVVRRMREDAALRRTPCLLLTASEDRSEELRALEAGADGFVRKNEDFDVLLARLAAVLRAASTPSALHSQSSVLGPKKILAVDDSLTYLEELATQLRQEGYDVVLAHSGEEALELLPVQSVDCILLDIVMPGLSRNETCRRIKNFSEFRDIPLLMLTGLEERSAMIDGMNAGADDYIPKSSDFDIVRARVRAALRRKQFEDENRSVREQLLRKEMEAVEARAQRELAETRAALLNELRESEVRANIAADAANLGLWYWDMAADKHVWSERCKSLFGVSPKDTPTYELFLNRLHPDDRGRTEKLLYEALSNEGEYEVEYRIIWPDGSIHWIVSRGRCLYDDAGKPLRMTGVSMDVTDRKRTEEALIRSEKLGSVGRMAASMAHEINNPLAAVVNSLFLIACDESLSADTRAHLRVAERELERVVHMTRQTLGFYRENGRPSPIDLPELMKELLSLYSRKLNDKQIVLQTTCHASNTVFGSMGELRQILSNLLVNSIDAVAQGGVIRVRISDLNLNGQAVRVTVADNGCGIRRENLQSVFEPFFTTKNDVGTGLGLWVTRQIVEKHGGTIRVRSKVGKGTVFSVYLPVNTGATAEPDPPEPRAASA
jgi:two-component system, NtrC family, sensor kinase